MSSAVVPESCVIKATHIKVIYEDDKPLARVTLHKKAVTGLMETARKYLPTGRGVPLFTSTVTRAIDSLLLTAGVYNRHCAADTIDRIRFIVMESGVMYVRIDFRARSLAMEIGDQNARQLIDGNSRIKVRADSSVNRTASLNLTSPLSNAIAYTLASCIRLCYRGDPGDAVIKSNAPPTKDIVVLSPPLFVASVLLASKDSFRAAELCLFSKNAQFEDEERLTDSLSEESKNLK